MITDQDKLVRGSIAGWVLFRKPLRSETRLTKIDEMPQRVASRRIFSRKRIEKRSVKLKTSNIIPESFRFFVSPRKTQSFLRKRQSRRQLVASRKASKIIYPCNLLLASILIFSTFARQQSVLREILSSCWLDFRSSKAVEGFGKGQVWRHV